MANHDLVFPMFGMVLLTASTLLRTAWARVAWVRENPKNIKHFKLIDITAFPEHMALLTRNFTNLMEMPILFYVVCLIALTLQISSPILVCLAWSYVVLRAIHTIIHTTYNRVIHRFAAFLLSNVVLLILWIQTVVSVAKL